MKAGFFSIEGGGIILGNSEYAGEFYAQSRAS
jgi:hypothetical protein